jgi:UDP-N-acetylglucosamine--N-acetylmuramyl-(pentapeptide) pyrophosphoryl-undecaprenol N-acetylglucosamine transferase
LAAKTALLVAGGTGGHLFPAEALAHELKARGWAVHLATDRRAEKFAANFPSVRTHVIPSATIAGKNPIALARSMMTLWRGYLISRQLTASVKPSIVAGFGGYTTLPALFAASRMGIPTLIHEQNAVMGRANALLAKRVTAIAGGFLPEHGDAFPDKTLLTGNPVRPAVLEAAKTDFTAPGKSGAFNLLVFGGSQGAQYFSEAIPASIAMLDEGLRRRLVVTQQARAEDEAAVKEAYEKMGIWAEVSPFFDNMAGRIAASHLVISRAGASTVSEIAAIGRPSLLVPYPFALDHDQAANAAALEANGGTIVRQQKDLSPEILASIITEMAGDPAKSDAMAAAAKAAGKPRAASLLADLTEAIAGGKSVAQFTKEFHS